MKFKIISVLCFAFFLSLGCHKEDTQDGIDGQWSMVQASGGIAGFNQAYPKGKIIWKFEDNKISISNMYEGQLNFSFPTGNYNFQIVDEKDKSVLQINNDSYGKIVISNDSLTIDQSPFISDGFFYTFVRL